MNKEVAEKYKLVGITPGKHHIADIGIVDFSKITLAEADNLFALKVPFLQKVDKKEPAAPKP